MNIVSYDIFHNPSDTKTLIPFLEKIKSQNIEVKNVVADAGYESFSNYEYLKINNYVSYIKPIYYEKSKTRKYKKDLNRVENLEYNEEGELSALFRSEDHKNYKECGDKYIRVFLKGLTEFYRN